MKYDASISYILRFRKLPVVMGMSFLSETVKLPLLVWKNTNVEFAYGSDEDGMRVGDGDPPVPPLFPRPDKTIAAITTAITATTAIEA